MMRHANNRLSVRLPVMEYHWYYRAETALPVFTYPEELTNADRLCVACTQTGLTPSKQNALVRQWCKLLPTLDRVRTLWLTSRVPQALFDAACRIPNLEDLWVKWSGVTNITAIQGLPKLRYFYLGSSAGLHSISPLAEMAQLRWLGLENLKRIRTIEPVGSLTRLEGLVLQGSMWTTWKVKTLTPLSALENLRYLSLANLRSHDKTLAPLFALRRLETFIRAAWWDEGELQEIRKRNPRLTA